MEFRVVQVFAGRKRLLVTGEIICVSGFVFGVLLFSFFSCVIDFHMVFLPSYLLDKRCDDSWLLWNSWRGFKLVCTIWFRGDMMDSKLVMVEELWNVLIRFMLFLCMIYVILELGRLGPLLRCEFSHSCKYCFYLWSSVWHLSSSILLFRNLWLHLRIVSFLLDCHRQQIFICNDTQPRKHLSTPGLAEACTIELGQSNFMMKRNINSRR